MPLSEREGELHFQWEPACSDLYNFFQICRSMRMQVKFYHRYGEFDDCKRFTKEWAACMKTKMMKAEEAQEYYEKYQAEKRETAPQQVWEPRSTPPELFR